MPQALEGIRVLDLNSGPAGGIATMILADFGAEVLNIAPLPRWIAPLIAIMINLNSNIAYSHWTIA